VTFVWRQLVRISPLLAAFLLASLIANVSLFLFPYDWKREQSPPGKYRSQQPNGQQSETEQQTPAIRIQVECDRECSAKALLREELSHG
jgi:hypothetical protein